MGLLKLNLLRQALSDPLIRIVARPLDSSWMYQQVIPCSVSGFNPSLRRVYVNQRSAFMDWMKAGKKNDRIYNEGDFLVREALFVIHDYLHCWTYLVIQEEMPELEFGHGRIREKNREDFVFCHLLTEAVATVGLDYWYLSTMNLGEYTDTGTNFETLTVRYHEKNLPEYRKFNSDLFKNPEDIFRAICEFYLSGIFQGVSIGDARRSPKLLSWLRPEIEYGEKQRQYTRAWIRYLSGERIRADLGEYSAPITGGQAWKRRLIKRIGERLWTKVKEGKDHPFRTSPPVDQGWNRRKVASPDFRFCNLNAFTDDELAKIVKGAGRENFDSFFAQWVSRHCYELFPKDLLPVLPSIREKADFTGLIALFSGRTRIGPTRPADAEPLDLFFLN